MVADAIEVSWIHRMYEIGTWAGKPTTAQAAPRVAAAAATAARWQPEPFIGKLVT